jgi:Fe-S cluster assembly ATP-binding protein
MTDPRTSDGAIHELRITDLRAGVQAREVLRGVDIVVRSGEVHAVMGPNGSGKSTLAHVVMGHPGYDVLGGSVTLDGTELLGKAAWERARRGLFLATQYPTEVPGVALVDVLAGTRTRFLAPSPQWVEAREEVVSVASQEAAKLGLDQSFLDRAVNVDLSGGERKRSEVLQFGVLRPAFAILDELDSGLDVDGLRAVGRRVHEAVDDWGVGVLAITHYRRLLTALRPDVVHVFANGRIVDSGGPELAESLEITGYGAYGVEELDAS